MAHPAGISYYSQDYCLQGGENLVGISVDLENTTIF